MNVEILSEILSAILSAILSGDLSAKLTNVMGCALEFENTAMFWDYNFLGTLGGHPDHQCFPFEALLQKWQV